MRPKKKEMHRRKGETAKQAWGRFVGDSEVGDASLEMASWEMLRKRRQDRRCFAGETARSRSLHWRRRGLRSFARDEKLGDASLETASLRVTRDGTLGVTSLPTARLETVLYEYILRSQSYGGRSRGIPEFRCSRIDVRRRTNPGRRDEAV
jgi:hypothetical protein